jgi:hypothetical protein
MRSGSADVLHVQTPGTGVGATAGDGLLCAAGAKAVNVTCPAATTTLPTPPRLNSELSRCSRNDCSCCQTRASLSACADAASQLTGELSRREPSSSRTPAARGDYSGLCPLTSCVVGRTVSCGNAAIVFIGPPPAGERRCLGSKPRVHSYHTGDRARGADARHEQQLALRLAGCARHERRTRPDASRATPRAAFDRHIARAGQVAFHRARSPAAAILVATPRFLYPALTVGRLSTVCRHTAVGAQTSALCCPGAGFDTAPGKQAASSWGDEGPLGAQDVTGAGAGPRHAESRGELSKKLPRSPAESARCSYSISACRAGNQVPVTDTECYSA